MSTLPPDLLCKCLADATRARITLLVMREKELCVCELTCALGEIQPKISRHLAQLRSSGLLIDRRKGQWIFYSIHPQLPEWIKVVLGTMLQANSEWLKADSKRLSAMKDRPTACC